MGYTDKTLQCSDCGANFTFTAEEQEFYATKGYTNEPKRCPSCRAEKRNQRNSLGGYNTYKANRQMYSAVCAGCGKACEVPFEPREGRPVYCSDCYRKNKLSR